MAYATVAELADHLGMSDNLNAGVMVSTERTARYNRALDAATAVIDSKCGRTFTATNAGVVRYFVPSGGDTLLIDDVTTVTEVKVDDDANGTYETTLTTNDYELNQWGHYQSTTWPYSYIVRLDDSWPTPSWTGRRRLVKITGTWGWASVPVPVKQACIILAARYLQRGNAALGVQGVSDFGPFTIRSTDPDVDALLTPYVKLGVL